MGSPQRVLILFAHPALHKSRINRHLADAVRGLDGVTFHDLYEEYPDLLIDADREQALLREHDIIVLQHPFYWYSSPSILKEWQDIVLEYGFAYGENGTALRGKLWMNAITTGGPQDAYRPEGFNRFTIRQLMLPFEQTAHLCGMTFLEPFVIHGAHALTPAEISANAEAYRRAVASLRESRDSGAPAKNSDHAS